MNTYYLIDPEAGGAEEVDGAWVLDWAFAMEAKGPSVRAAIRSHLDEQAEEAALADGDFEALVFVSTHPDGRDAKAYRYQVRVEWTYDLHETYEEIAP